jgi:addiction module RelE/StbE family toxin
MQVKWTRRALANLESVLDYISKDKPQAAARFGAEVRKKVTVLEEHPHLGRASDVPGVRELLIHPNYFVIYRVRDDELQILRFRHARRKPLTAH